MAWLAGLLEGEGTFGTITSRVAGRGYRYPKIAVNMTDRDVIKRAAAILGNGSVYDMPPSKKYPDRKRQFRAQISGAGAAEWMRKLYPWLGARRRARIDEVLAEYDAMEPTAARRSRSCRDAANARYAREKASS